MDKPETIVNSTNTCIQKTATDLKHKRPSYIWHYFDKKDDIIRCKVCNEERRTQTNATCTSSLIRHLEIVHGLTERGVVLKDLSSLPTIHPINYTFLRRTFPRSGLSRPSLENQEKEIHTGDRIFANFEKNEAGVWCCKKCDFVCPTANNFEMFHHLTTVHWNSSIPTTNDDRIGDNTLENTNASAENTDDDDLGDFTGFSNVTSPETISEDKSRTCNNLGNIPGPKSSKKKVLATELTKDNNRAKNYHSRTDTENKKGDGKGMEKGTLGKTAVNKNHKSLNLFPIVLLERLSLNLQKAIQHRKEDSRNGPKNSRVFVSPDRRKFHHPYLKESGGMPVAISPKQMKSPRLHTDVRQWKDIRNDTVRIKSEKSDDPRELEIQVPLQYERSLTAENGSDKDGRISMRYECIRTEIAGEKKNVAVITLNRPKALNALCKRLVDEVNDAVTKFDSDASVGAIIITGNETAFAAGTDIKEMQNYTYAQAIKKKFLISWDDISNASKPVIAAVNGYALGGGCELALTCDIIYAGEKASFGQPEIIFGTIPAAGGIQRLTRAIGKSKAMEMVLTGNQISALEAEKSGLVSKVFPPEELLSGAIKLGERISTHSELIVSMAKEAVNSAYETTLEEGLCLEKKIFCGTLATADRKEGMAAFVERRAPKFRNE